MATPRGDLGSPLDPSLPTFIERRARLWLPSPFSAVESRCGRMALVLSMPMLGLGILVTEYEAKQS
jgi:hypothetical protein